MGFFLFISIGLQGQQRLPAFTSELLEAVEFDPALKNSPSKYFIKKYTYDKASGKLQPDDVVLHYYYQEGLLDHVEFVNEKDTLKAHYYDQYGRTISQERFGFKENITRIAYSYDDALRLATETVFRIGDRIHSKAILKFNNQNRLTSKEEYRGAKQLSKYWIYTYNQYNDLVSDQYFNASGRSNDNKSITYALVDSTYFKHTYDSENRRKRTLKYHDNHLDSDTQLSYFKDSTIKKETFYAFNGNSNEQHVQIEKDSLKIVIRGFFYDGDTTRIRSRFKEVFLYDDLVTYEKRTLSGTYVDRYKTYYEYDEIGNWIKKTTYSNGLIVKKEERIIIY